MTRDRPSSGHTVRRLAALAGVSVRTLHHYDAIGLLRPGYVGGNGYRYYGRRELLRLQQILLHRHLGLSLAEIAAILDAPDFDQVTALERQRDRLTAEREQLTAMIATLDNTLADLKGHTAMTDADLYSGFVSPEQQAGYERWIGDRYGAKGEAWMAEARSRPAPSPAETGDAMAELKAIETALADHMRSGVAPDAAVLDADLERHRAWVSSQWGRACPPMAYANLADMYEHPDLRARYYVIAPGLEDWLPQAMRVHATRHAASLG